jgi:hypothetical protein
MATKMCPLVRARNLKPPGRIKAIVTAANRPLAEEMATGDQWMDLINTPDMLHKVAAKIRNKIALALGLN